ncbi:DNA repair protein rad13 [Drechslerella dactyloides]|uniref:DNA repair protein rad13 n=1 Tax=Drechslerella dactyloides TaxID=74499 RepID=A0AAD6IQZ4_DREDA|nr:DNA repair protein rad13 [Drechslerella dactyloides]
MGVTGLWTVVQPCARPVKLETLAQRRLAIDASIWIYQFLKAVRDKEGNALRNAHVVGFFRRIVKLLFHGIHPVFVFDGGAPLLKKQTIANRKSHRQDRKEDASNTARKLLSLQMQKKAKEEVEQRRQAAERHSNQIQEEEPVPENPVYASELFQRPEERRANRTTFRKTDQYHLPEMDHNLESMRGINDPRIMSMEELEQYARRFEGGEDINLYDFSKIDFDSPFFTSLPAADRYNILNAARIRSRLRMGLSKDQLEQMFPNRLEFSRFQIERVRERNELTQRLMNLNGMNDDLISVRRVAGEKDREYVLVKNEGAEGGWALGVVGQKGVREGEAPHKAIVLDEDEKKEEEDDDGWEDEMDEFEDIPIEGLNRLPKPRTRAPYSNFPQRRQTSEEREIQRAIKLSKQEQQKNALKGSDKAPVFIQDDELSEFEDAVNEYDELFEDLDKFEQDLEHPVDDEDDLRKAIAMSLEKDKKEGEEEEKALELAIRTSLQQESEGHEAGLSSRPLNPAKPKFIEQPLNPSKPRFSEFGESSSVLGSSSARPSSLPAQPKAQVLPADDSGSVKPLNRAKSKFTEIDMVEPANPFIFEDGGFTLEDAITGTSTTGPAASEKHTDFSLDSNLLPFESMKLGGFAGLEKRLQEERSRNGEQDKTSETEKREETLPPWFSAQENAAFKAGSAGYRRDDYDRDDEAEKNKAQIPEHLKPLHERTTIQPVTTNVVVLSDEENDDVPMVDIVLNPKEPVTSASATSNFPEERLDRMEQVSTRLDEQDEDEEIEWELSDNETQQPAAPGDTSAQLDADMEYDAGLDSEEEQLLHQLEAENAEHARFASTFNLRSAAENAVDYDRELRALRDQQKKDRRDADEVTQIMIQECQQLLQMFGIPYITAPMEAEAQCAELVHLGLVDGIVTDDSDIFLFGGTRVYKNMFNQAKFVECYLATDLENEYSLDRKKLIRLAHLLGSDYTEGLPNVGPVTALEILAEFGGDDDALHEFKAWWTKIQSGFNDPVDERSKLKKSLKKLSDKLFLPMSFPDDRVDAAYLNPEVDKDTTPFEWGVPDLQGLRNYLMATIGWTSDRTDEILVPVIRDMNRKVTEGNQVNITNFFSGGTGAGAFAPRVREANKSRRMESALMSLHRQSIKRQGSSISATRDGESKKDDGSSSSDEETLGIVSLNGRVRVSAGGAGEARAKKKRKTGTGNGDMESSEDESDVEVVKVVKPKAKRKAKAGRSIKAVGRGRGRAK